MSDNLKVAKECGIVDDFGNIYVDSGESRNIQSELDAYTSSILASQQAAHEAEIARLKAEYDELDRHYADELAEGRQLRAACAMKDEALKASYLVVKSEKVKEAISATPQQVSEWERKQLAPLRAQVAVLHEMLARIGEYPKHGGWTNYEVMRLLTNTQSAAEQFITECEQRGAEKFKELLLEASKVVVHPHIEGVFAVYQSRTTSKKAG